MKKVVNYFKKLFIKLTNKYIHKTLYFINNNINNSTVLIFGITKEQASKLPKQNNYYFVKNKSRIKHFYSIIRLIKPIVIFDFKHNGKSSIQRNISIMLRRNHIPIFTATSESSLTKNINIINTEFIDYYPVVLSRQNMLSQKDNNKSIMLCLCDNYNAMYHYHMLFTDFITAFYVDNDKTAHALITFITDLQISRVVNLRKKEPSENLRNVLAQHGLSVVRLTQAEIDNLLLEHCEALGTNSSAKTKAVLLNADNPKRVLHFLWKKYEIFWLQKQRTSVHYLRLLRGGILIWSGGGVSAGVIKIANEIGATLLTIEEGILSRCGWRKSYSVPLFADVGPYAPAGLQVSRLMTMVNAPELDDEGLLARAATFRARYLDMRHSILEKYERQASAIFSDKSKHVLAVWEDHGECLDDQIIAFLESVRQREKRKKVFCLAVRNGEVFTPDGLPGLIRASCCFLTHPAEIDALLDSAAAVHVRSSLIGFEALLAGRPVITYGGEWYAGWGLTEDVQPAVRSRKLSLDQLTALTFFLSARYTAPYSHEHLSPEEALALWYMRQRPDFSRIFEGLQGDYLADAHCVLPDMRACYYDNSDIDTEVIQLLQASLLGSVVSDSLSFAFKSACYRKLLDTLPFDTALDFFNIMNMHAYYLANYELLNFYVQETCSWFSSLDISDSIQCNRFYRLYFDAVARNRFHDSVVPKYFKCMYVDEYSKRNILLYIRILTYTFSYDILSQFIDDLIPSSETYLQVIKILYADNRNLQKEIDIDVKIGLRLKAFSKFLETRHWEGLNPWPEELPEFIKVCLQEDRPRMASLSASLAPMVSKMESLPSDYAELVHMVADFLVSNREYTLASIVINMAPVSLKGTTARHTALLKDFAQPAAHGTFSRRSAQIDSALAQTLANLKASATYEQWLTRANTYALFRHYQKTSEIIMQAQTGPASKGTLFLGYYGSFLTATLPVVLNNLRARGYAVYPIFNNHIALPVAEHDPLAYFAYALPGRPGPLKLRWDVDLREKRVAALGVNLYERFLELIAMMLRRYDFDWCKPDAQRLFQAYLHKTDRALDWCDRLCRAAKSMPLRQPIGIISMFAYQLPEAAFFDYIMAHGRDILRFIQFKNLANFDISHKTQTVATRISAFDMGLYPDSRLSYLPCRSRFSPWYDRHKNEPAFMLRLDKTQKELLAQTDTLDSPFAQRLHAAKAGGKKIVCCICRLLFDQAVRKDGGPGHANMADWLRHTVATASSIPDMLLIVRPHPLEANSTASVRARQTVRDMLPECLPNNVVCMDPSDMGMWQLAGMLDLAIIWVGTAAYELTAMGVPVAVCAWAGHDQTPFDVIYPQNRTAYEALLRAEYWPKPDQEAQNRAAACVEYIRSAGIKQDYPYAFVRESNSFRIIPWYHNALLEKYFAEGDPRIDIVADQIVEGMKC